MALAGGRRGEKEGTGASGFGPIRALLSEVPAVVQLGGAVAAVVLFAVPALGHLALSHRAELMGLPVGLVSYAPEHLALTGASMLWKLPWRMAYALVHGELFLTGAAWLAVLGAFLAGRPARMHSRLRVLALVGLSIVVLLGAVCLRRLLAPNGASLASGQMRDIVSMAEFEVHSWLVNPGELNRRRREALAGVGGWIGLLCGSLAVAWVDRSRGTHGAGRVSARVASALLALSTLFLIGQLPRAHALASWGRQAPRAHGIVEQCGQKDLGAALAAGLVDGWLVAPNAREEYLAILDHDPLSNLTFVPLTEPEGGRCAVLGREEVVGNVQRTRQ